MRQKIFFQFSKKLRFPFASIYDKINPKSVKKFIVFQQGCFRKIGAKKAAISETEPIQPLNVVSINLYRNV